jgi:hypothetical protein
MDKLAPQLPSARSNGTKKLSLPTMVVLAIVLLNILAPAVSAKSKLVPGEKIKTNKFIESSNKRFYLSMQYDGNAVIYDRNGEGRSMKVAGGQDTSAETNSR